MTFQNLPTEGNVPMHTTNAREINNCGSQHMLYYHLAPFKVPLSKSSTCLLWNTPVNVMDTSSQASTAQYQDSYASTLFIEGLEDEVALKRVYIPFKSILLI